MSALLSPFTVGFAVALIPAAWLYFASYRSEEQRLEELQKRGYTPSAALPRNNSAANQQLLHSIFSNRHEPDLYTALGEINRKAPATLAASIATAATSTSPTAPTTTANPPTPLLVARQEGYSGRQ